MMTDPIADMLTRIRNAYLVHKKEVVLSSSKIKQAIAEILVREGYLAKVEKKEDKHPYLVLTLKYAGSEPAASHLKRVSKPGGRVYVRANEIGTVLNGFGVYIISTPQGVKTGQEAISAKLGGEVLCEIY
ncbi:MAG: 30S ribosomal protein S8 [Candidatus Magasanikbacteria bacterium GW2011_GWC2_34_16]|uniref:Small ribosomal subunit protein uS8 n=2 Tax=Candidatus Magasanikiibacteriota TaxID=1752731 RepID=A0A0G0HL52_9BACT|nr:MAG: 30S ribosomal protein S8 [Candidatus Magasanikbacteria bacterium GW2011_GWC2_34_16]KKQ39295.1 MAG: 30S ribosomal protein S8 [Candidatus Magasanikbacteria bacterium GW2011_GWA2_37_8]